MPVTHRAVLCSLIDRYEETGQPQPPESIATDLDISTDEAAETLRSLAEYELVVLTDSSYRPTVTAHELLELDLFDDGGIIIDVRGE